MTDAVKGRTLDEARRLFEQFLALVTDDSAALDETRLGKLAVFAGVRDYPTPRQVRQPRLAHPARRRRGSPRGGLDGVGGGVDRP